MRPLVLLANDDGITAPNLLALRDELRKEADVVVCAPELNQSATSHSLSLHRPLRLRKTGEGLFCVDGTPADCVYVALSAGERVLPRRPDLCVSGLNHGLNLGVDVFYSGTVAAAREAALRGIPAIATSADREADRTAAAELSASIARALWERNKGGGAVLLNVNIPPGSSWNVRSTCLGARLYDNHVVFREDPRGREYLWIGGAVPRHEPLPGSDTDAFDAGEVSVTPLSLDLFDAGRAALAHAIAAAVTNA